MAVSGTELLDLLLSDIGLGIARSQRAFKPRTSNTAIGIGIGGGGGRGGGCISCWRWRWRWSGLFRTRCTCNVLGNR
jgi:hypothetical protein